MIGYKERDNKVGLKMYGPTSPCDTNLRVSSYVLLVSVMLMVVSVTLKPNLLL